MTRRLRIGKVAELVGVSPSTLRNYEKQGRIPPAERTVAGYRVYPAETVAAIEQAIIRTGQE